ncbi:MAG TPA: class I SAM-dependent methyltransferase [Nitrososphaeraceae archaeon]|nr:class I SAM-dependent methyltransferase [Nitrososphaeraceae archaeon]
MSSANLNGKSVVIDQSKAEAFAGRMLDVLNSSLLGLMISIGYQTNLFDIMSRLSSPSTSVEIAKAANLNERYVREWLGAMVTGKIVEYNPDTSKYRLPPEHAAFLTKDAGIDNMAVFMQYISLLGDVEQKVIECFRKGGGVPYSAFPRFQQLQAEDTARVFDARLIDQIVPLVDGLGDRLRAGIDVLDVGCGQGHAINLMARTFPNSRFTGYDISKEGIEAGREEAKQMGLTNVNFEVRNVASINEHEKYDLITAFDVIHDQAQPAKVLKEIYNALRNKQEEGGGREKGGIFLMQDMAASSKLEENVENPLGPTLYSISTMHCMTVSLAYNGEGLGTVWGRQKAEEMLKEAGFSEKIEVKEVSGDIFNYYYIVQKV